MDPHDHSPAHQHNRRAWDAMVQRGDRFTRPAHDAELVDPMSLVDQGGWLPHGVAGKQLLCLGAGGGRQSALYASAGAHVTVVDISPAMLELDRQVATERRLDIRTVEASLDQLAMFRPGEFEIVIQPVSTCYVPDIVVAYREVARVTAAGGIYISQHKTPASLQADTQRSEFGYELIEPYYRQGPLPPVAGSRHREEGTLEFLHRWEDLVGGLCRSGFVVEDLTEPLHAKPDATRNSFEDRSSYVAPYVRIKARRLSGEASQASVSLWTGLE